MCTYKSNDGAACARSNVRDTDYCTVHYGWNLTPEERKSLPPNNEFQETLNNLVADGNGNWQGFVFVAGTALPSQIQFPVIARGCHFEFLEINRTVFENTVDFSESVFNGTTELRGVRFGSTATFERCRFNGPVSFLNVIHDGAASFHRAEFSDRTIIRSNFCSSANLNEVVFRGAVSFAGWRNVSGTMRAGLGTISISAHGTALGGKPPTTMQRLRASVQALRKRAKDAWHRCERAVKAAAEIVKTRYRLMIRRYSTSDPNTRIFRVFEGDGQLQGVIFMQPEQTSFSQLDLSNVYVKGTNFNGVRFLAVNWWQQKLKRNGLRDEIFIRMSPDGPFRYLEFARSGRDLPQCPSRA